VRIPFCAGEKGAPNVEKQSRQYGYYETVIVATISLAVRFITETEFEAKFVTKA
jgi:hypothetical protein